jgi:hypothetical protein
MSEIGESKLLDSTRGNRHFTGGAQPENCESDRAITLELLKQDWPHLAALERGERLQIVVAQGWSRRRLARELGCSPALIRQLIALAEMSEDEKQVLSSGKHGRKKMLALSRSRRAEKKLHTLLEDEKAREGVIEKCAQLVVDFVGPRVAPCDRMCFFGELQRYVNALRSDHPSRIQRTTAEFPSDPWTVIDACKPAGSEPASVPEQINFVLHWLLRWIPKVIPSEVLDAAYDQAEYNLLHGGPAAPSKQHEQNRYWSIAKASLEEVDLLVELGRESYMFGKLLFAKH